MTEKMKAINALQSAIDYKFKKDGRTVCVSLESKSSVDDGFKGREMKLLINGMEQDVVYTSGISLEDEVLAEGMLILLARKGIESIIKENM